MMPARRYAAVAQTTASKERTLVLLLRKAAVSMEIGREHLVVDAVRADAALERALEIVALLSDTLDPQNAGQRAVKDVYGFVTWRLTRALHERDVADVEAAARAFRPVVEAFEQAVEQVAHGG